MKKIIIILLAFLTFSAYGQAEYEKIAITENVETASTSKIVSQQPGTGELNYINATALPISTAAQTALDLKQTVFTGICQEQYLTENDIVIDNTTLTLTIATVRNGSVISSLNPVRFFTDGSGKSIMHEKTAPVVFNFTNTTGVWYFYFNSSGTPIASQTVWSDFSTTATVYRFYWNATLGVADRRVIESVEYHKNDVSWVDHAWKHLDGAKWASGLELSSNAISSGTPNVNGSNAVVTLSSGTVLDDNIYYTLTNAASGTTKFTQNLGSGLLPATSGKFITISNDAGGLLQKIPATDFPFLWNATTNTPEYLTVNGTRTGVTANYFFVYYVYALQDPRRGETIKIKSAEIDFANTNLAAAHSWEQLQSIFPTLRDGEIRLLYKLTFEYKTAYDIGTKKSVLRVVDDLRKQKTTTSAVASGIVPATNVSVSPVGGIASTNAQSALQELDSEKANIITPSFVGGVTINNTGGTATSTALTMVGDNGSSYGSRASFILDDTTSPYGRVSFVSRFGLFQFNQEFPPYEALLSINNIAKIVSVSSLEASGTISALPATLPNQVVTKAQLDLKLDIGSAFTAGRIPYTSSASAISDSSRLLWNNTSSYLEVNGSAPRFTLKNNLNNFSTYFTNDAYGTLFLKNHQDKTLAAFNNPVNSTEQPQMAIGKVSSIPVESQLYVYGGQNGANIDARGSATTDEANIDLEGNDWETAPNSLGFSYYGSNATTSGTVLGYAKNKMGHIRFQETNTALITSSNTTPIRFGVNNVEILNVNSGGLNLVGTNKQFLMPTNVTTSIPQLSFSAAPDLGLMYDGYSGCLVANGGVQAFWGNGGMGIYTKLMLGGSNDTYISRHSAGVAKITTDGTVLGSMLLNNITLDGSLSLSTTPTTSAGAYRVLTYNETTDAVESVASSVFANASSGSYTPTFSDTVNISSLTFSGTANYVKVGNIVTVNVGFNATATAAGSAVEFNVSLPVNRAGLANYPLGSGVIKAGANFPITVSGNSQTLIHIIYTPTSTTAGIGNFQFQYDVSQ